MILDVHPPKASSYCTLWKEGRKITARIEAHFFDFMYFFFLLMRRGKEGGGKWLRNDKIKSDALEHWFVIEGVSCRRHGNRGAHIGPRKSVTA